MNPSEIVASTTHRVLGQDWTAIICPKCNRLFVDLDNQKAYICPNCYEVSMK